MNPVHPQSKIIASYHSESIDIDFKKNAGRVFAKTVVKGKSPIQYPLDPSLSTMEVIPLDLLSESKRVKWLLKNQYFPSIQNGKIVFHFHDTSEKEEPFFLKIKNKIDVPSSQDIEGDYCKCLLQAKRQNFVEEQIFYIKKLSDLYIQKHDFLRGAKLLNCAIALLPQMEEASHLKEYLFSQLKLIEEQFLHLLGIKASSKRETHYRDSLQKIRMTAALAHEHHEPIQQTLGALTQAFQRILSELISETVELLGPSPVKWACIGMGSMSRDEMCPYSDLEFAFLLEKDTPQAMEYFRTLSKILELKVINLGETKFPVFGGGYDSPTPNGFCLDAGGNTPLGMTGVYELIGTPAQLAQFQEVKWIDKRGIILPNAMGNVCLVTGDPNLVVDYTKAKEIVQQSKAQVGQSRNERNEEVLAMRLLAGHLFEFHPDLSKERETAFGVKKDLYRPFQEILSSLAILYHLKAKSTLARIDELQQMNVFSAQGAENLKKAFSKVLSLRLQVHLFYKDEKEFLCHPEEGKPKDPSLLYMNDSHIESLHEIYQVLLPFHKCACEFYQTKDAKSLNSDNFFDDSPSVRGKTFEKIYQYAKAKEAYQQAVVLNPNDIIAQLRLGAMEEKTGKIQEALLRNLMTLKLAQQNYGENHLYTAMCYNNVGGIYKELSIYNKALESYQKALNVYIPLLSNSHPFVATSYNNIGNVYLYLGQYKKAIECFQESLNIESQTQGDNHPRVAITYINMGGAYYHLEKNEIAFKYYQLASTIYSPIDHPDMAKIYLGIGAIYHSTEEYDKAIEAFEAALKIQQQTFLGDNNPDVAASYNNIGTIYDSLGKYNKALEYYRKALKIWLQIVGKNSLQTATTYNGMGNIYFNQGKYEQALVYFRKTSEISVKIFPKNHPKVAESYLSIGLSLQTLGKTQEAWAFYQQAYNILLPINGPTDLVVQHIETKMKEIADPGENRSANLQAAAKELQQVNGCIICLACCIFYGCCCCCCGKGTEESERLIQ